MAKRGCRGYVPNKDEVRQYVNTLSAERYGGRYLPGLKLADQQRPKEWCSARTLLRSYGYTCDGTSWKKMLRALGLKPSVASLGVALTGWHRTARKEAMLDEPLEATGLARTGLDQISEARKQAPTWNEEDIECIERLRPVLAWSIRSHKYVVIGYRLVYELR
jgi:hypothetical protein